MPQISNTPCIRVSTATQFDANPNGHYVLYWMTAFRRLESNFALQRATELALVWNKPLIVLEGLRIGYRWASDRFHRFVLDGMLDNQQAAKALPLTYLAYVEHEKGEGTGLVETFAKQACVVVTDDFPCFFHPKLYKRIVSQWQCAVELVDSNGILPIHAADRTFTVAHSYRRYMQKQIARESPIFPDQNPFLRVDLPKLKKLPEEITKRWKFLSCKELQSYDLSKLDIDHSVAVTETKGGRVEALRLLNDFTKKKLVDYEQARNEPDQHGSSALSAHLHFGHISAHEIFQAIVSSVSGWSFSSISKPNGKMNGFWNLGIHGEAFMDQLMTWREIGFNMCAREVNYDRYDSLPDWARKTLKDHANDKRPYVYTLEEFESARTHDSLWNAAQRQLVIEGRIHNYLRMLWGKKILNWTRTPQEALDVMIHLNNKYALDGRDPNSYSGIFWVLGRYDRAWGPEREVFGKIRYMTSESTRSKFSVKVYMNRFAEFDKRIDQKANTK